MDALTLIIILTYPFLSMCKRDYSIFDPQDTHQVSLEINFEAYYKKLTQEGIEVRVVFEYNAKTTKPPLYVSL